MGAGGSERGGIYDSRWQGLAAGQAIDAVPGLNDYRHALAEILSTALGIADLNYIFPGFTPSFHGIL